MEFGVFLSITPAAYEAKLGGTIGFDFDTDYYSHSARYDPAHGRVEMRLISSKSQTVTTGDVAISIGAGESILTEYSHKYTLDDFAAMASHAGFTVEKVWTDAERLFSVQYCVRK